MNAVSSQEEVDAALEEHIEALYQRMIHEPDEEKARGYFREMADQITRRSPAQIKKMQREKRLHRE